MSISKEISDTAVIENPCNKDEILIFDGYGSNDVYIYNKNTNTIKRNDVSISKISERSIASVYEKFVIKMSD